MLSPEHSDYGTSSLLLSDCLFCFSMFESVLDVAGQHSLCPLDHLHFHLNSNKKLYFTYHSHKPAVTFCKYTYHCVPVSLDIYCLFSVATFCHLCVCDE